MNLLIFEKQDLTAGNHILVSGERAKHLQNVLHVLPGSKVKIGELGGLIGSGIVKEIGNSVLLEIQELTQNPPTPAAELILALPRPQMLKRILENSITLGVCKLYLINSQRVEKSFFSSPVLKPENIKKHLIIGLEQAATTILPVVEVFKSFKVFSEKILKPEQKTERLRLIAHNSALSQPLAKVVNSYQQSALPASSPVVAIGPEGGWLDYEVKTFGEYGFKCVSLGKLILRVETAVSVTLAQITNALYE
ncbi:MAG: 16S rRNA (uracil(1498)-N(3))-methyltransferase [Deltaproteobacteria bacterium]|nr:16S rRNA (uracil(1498)-N(3))-methyltransferase [Deltaproteobacteria bacterium]